MKKTVITVLIILTACHCVNAQFGGLLNKAKGGSSSSSNNLSKRDQETLKNAIKESENTQKEIENQLKTPAWKSNNYINDLRSKTKKLNSSVSQIKTLNPSYDVSAFKKTELDANSKIDSETGAKKPVSTENVNVTAKQEEKKGYVYVWDKSSKYYVKNEGFTSKFHEQNAGKILFSDKEIKRENTDPSYFKTSFDNNSSAIFGRVYLPTSVCNYPIYVNADSTKTAYENKGAYYRIELYADGEFFIKTDVNNSATKNIDPPTTTFYSNILWSPDKRGKQWNDVVTKLNTLKPGIHKMKLILKGEGANKGTETVEPIAFGEFDLNILAGKKFKYFLKWTDVKVGMVNEGLTAKALSICNAKAKDEKWVEVFKKAKITSKEWTIYKNYLGVPEYRTISIELYSVFPDSRCKTVNMSFKQDYLNGSYGSLKYYSIGSYSEIDCD